MFWLKLSKAFKTQTKIRSPWGHLHTFTDRFKITQRSTVDVLEEMNVHQGTKQYNC